MTQKLQSLLVVEGESLENGLGAYREDGDDLMLALARARRTPVRSSRSSNSAGIVCHSTLWFASASVGTLLRRRLLLNRQATSGRCSRVLGVFVVGGASGTGVRTPGRALQQPCLRHHSPGPR